MTPDAHGEDARALEIDSPALMDHPDAVDLPMRAGDLVVADGRLLHAAHPNTTDARRTFTLAPSRLCRVTGLRLLHGPRSGSPPPKPGYQPVLSSNWTVPSTTIG